MRYYYLQPFHPQFFFQAECIDSPLFLSLYQPYTFIGEISWLLWRNSKLYRQIFSKPNIEAYIPEIQIRKILGNDSILGINSGSPGPERKITVIGLRSKIPFFCKLAQTEVARKLVQNEYHILKHLDGNEFTPYFMEFITIESLIGIKTEFLHGIRIADDKINEDIIRVINKISSHSIPGCNMVKTNLQTSFAHGDFCPWNLMNVKGRLKAFDWEMAGYYPLGYDLFTFIFQTSFLLHPGKSIDKIIKSNINSITNYFGSINWQPYLASFAEIKFEAEFKKSNKRLFPRYKELSIYAKQI